MPNKKEKEVEITSTIDYRYIIPMNLTYLVRDNAQFV